MINSQPTPHTPARSSRRWFQFSLRTLLIVVSIVAVGMGLLMRSVHEQRAAVQREKEAVAEIEKLGGWMFDTQSQSVLQGFPSWLRNILGDEAYRPVISVRFVVDSSITDKEIVHLAKLSKLHSLDLSFTQITHAGLIQLSNLKKLQHLKRLIVDSTQITDEGLLHISKLTELTSLSMIFTQITDEGLVHMENLSKLRELSLNRTQVTDAGLQKLQAALPNCQIVK